MLDLKRQLQYLVVYIYVLSVMDCWQTDHAKGTLGATLARP